MPGSLAAKQQLGMCGGGGGRQDVGEEGRGARAAGGLGHEERREVKGAWTLDPPGSPLLRLPKRGWDSGDGQEKVKG